ncbi:Translation initiation factor 3 subunit c [Komagataella phaffii CBS 7435]|uniref:Eukaryotic translation initiation factor 3 subunit C n=2 Tax=Komagataella phaffii TaxID=460519 RepID=C4R5J0_KOMPG|nr:Subunit of the eukaryotic translation initiation factor 3 (eIF3) [Komagataella phaffii GS115]AOA63503.1 GQ67_03873T0 [Komagataella phaffii]CAH2449389.1 Translation initiation factor 3 subunit c [Komagataella phaffii CBS 7435]AOA68298.1 GQ68_03847T0 [Komagataella phaffii GS115]CAY70826.1 Subunit of the eukaryotic translation initiation factor 3 (eIF3) [Komagataella phaffii GS115]CCA39381.1 Translation initiation factor 3 subunit c [Komagataella phaffii CBS 7435]
MSRFFASGYSDSDLSSSDEELLSTSEEELINSSADEQEAEQDNDESSDSVFATEEESDDSSDDDYGARARGPSYFLKSSFAKNNYSDEDSESEGEGKKVVKSSKDKLLDEMRSLVDKIEIRRDVKEWIGLLAEFDKLNKLLTKARQQNLGIPRLYISMIAELDSTISEIGNEEIKALKADSSRAFNTTKQRTRRFVKEHAAAIEQYRANPETFEKELDEQSEENTPKPSKALIDELITSLRTIQETRGKKNVDRDEQIATLEELVQDAKGNDFHSILVYLMLIPLRFESSSLVQSMPIDQWTKAKNEIIALLKILEKVRNEYVVTELATATDELGQEPEADKNGVKHILGSVTALVERLDDELTKSLQSTDPHATEYVDRLKDQSTVYQLLLANQLYLESIIEPAAYSQKEGEQLARVVLKRLENLYYKPTKLIIISEKVGWSKLTNKQSLIYPKFEESDDELEYCNGLINHLSSLLYKQTNSIFRKKAMLCQIYYYSFNDQYYKARDMFLMSHLQSTIHTSDIPLQVLFNRALVQLGLCAFRAGLLTESQQILQEICTSQKQKELLGQGSNQRQQPASQIDKQRLVPFHMHINLELLDCVYLTASLLLEIPQIIQQSSGRKVSNKLQATKSFRRTLDYYNRQVFIGPPESTKDYIMRAASSLQAGKWEQAINFISSINIWSLFNNATGIKEMLYEKFQTEGLRSYIFANIFFYEKLSVKQLASLFKLPEAKVLAVVSKMIYNDEISASLDQFNQSIDLSKDYEFSKLHELALSLADRCQQLAERNERLASGGHQSQSSNVKDQKKIYSK